MLPKLSSLALKREMTKTECEMARDVQLSLSKSLLSTSLLSLLSSLSSSLLLLCTDVTIGKDRTTPPDWKNVIFPGHSVSAQVFQKREWNRETKGPLHCLCVSVSTLVLSFQVHIHQIVNI